MTTLLTRPATSPVSQPIKAALTREAPVIAAEAAVAAPVLLAVRPVGRQRESSEVMNLFAMPGD